MRLIFDIVKQLTKITNNSYVMQTQAIELCRLPSTSLCNEVNIFASNVNTEESFFSKYVNYSLAFIKN